VDLQSLGKLMIVLAIGLAIVGGLLWVGGRLGMGPLPGDLRLQGEGWSCFVPIAASILLSIVLTIVVSLVIRWFR
jgi:hypothetical protein